ncbi:MAG: hypothetical protein LBC70_06575 [Chitinispirillales bacterium]|nr:hypothetical protein [Chitinispirillales bacterium]
MSPAALIIPNPIPDKSQNQSALSCLDPAARSAIFNPSRPSVVSTARPE